MLDLPSLKLQVKALSSLYKEQEGDMSNNPFLVL